MEIAMWAGVLGGACYFIKVLIEGTIQAKEKTVEGAKIAKSLPTRIKEWWKKRKLIRAARKAEKAKIEAAAIEAVNSPDIPEETLSTQ